MRRYPDDAGRMADTARATYGKIFLPQMYAIESGRYDPSLPLAFAIARVFARRIEDIFVDKA